MKAYVVESTARDSAGVKRGTFRLYVATEARAQQIVADGARNGDARTYREISGDEMPERARVNLARVL